MSRVFIRAAGAGLISGVFATFLRLMNEDRQFLEQINPDPIVFNVFIVFASLVATFRTSHALVRFTEAAAMMHKLAACWYDASCTLVTFCRPAYSTKKKEVVQFQETLFRLISVLNALVFNSLEHKGDIDFEESHVFEVLGWEDLCDDVQDGVRSSNCKVEYIFQCIQQLVVDSMEAKVLAVPPPILTRSFQELCSGMQLYHECKKLSHEPLPLAYRLITGTILVSEAFFLPFMIAMFTAGSLSCFSFTCVGTFLLWFLNGVAESLDNPFKKDSSTLNTAAVQLSLNEQLKGLRRHARQAMPSLSKERVGSRGSSMITASTVQGAISGSPFDSKKSLTASVASIRVMGARLSARKSRSFGNAGNEQREEGDMEDDATEAVESERQTEAAAEEDQTEAAEEEQHEQRHEFPSEKAVQAEDDARQGGREGHEKVLVVATAVEAEVVALTVTEGVKRHVAAQPTTIGTGHSRTPPPERLQLERGQHYSAPGSAQLLKGGDTGAVGTLNSSALTSSM